MAHKKEYCKKCPFTPDETKPFICVHGNYFCSPECPKYKELVMGLRHPAAALDEAIKKDLI